MKKPIPVYTFLFWISCWWPLWAEKPFRYVEFGLDGNVGLASNYIGLWDVFNEDRVVKLDLDALPTGDFAVNGEAGAQVFFNINFGEKFGLGFFAGVNTLFYQSLSHTLLKFLAQGNGDMRQYTSDIALGGSVFADAGIQMSLKIGKLHAGFSPAMYVPLLYLPKPLIRYQFDSIRDSMYLDINADVNAYSPISIEQVMEGNLAISTETIMELLDARGFDFSLNAEYALVPMLDVGGVVTNIPLIPAVLTHQTHIDFHYRYDPAEGIYDSLLNNSFEFDDVEFNDPVYSDNASFRVFRPLRFDCYVLFKPLVTNRVIIKPNIGFSVLTIYDEACFNMGLEAQLRFGRILFFRIGTLYQEKIWRNQFNLGLNLRLIELDLGLNLQSQDLKGLFDIKGAGVSIGIRIGF
ncbi:MAG: hypothetical protein LBT13_07685 [Treponema sp.]|jgi:hypothetical protein|nr:hypothetical protein [Treponema sp.]